MSLANKNYLYFFLKGMEGLFDRFVEAVNDCEGDTVLQALLQEIVVNEIKTKDESLHCCLEHCLRVGLLGEAPTLFLLRFIFDEEETSPFLKNSVLLPTLSRIFHEPPSTNISEVIRVRHQNPATKFRSFFNLK
jgi:hypothetical protein